MTMPPHRHADVSTSDAPARAAGFPSPQEHQPSHGQMQDHKMMQGSYARFGAMILTSTVMMLVLMYSLVLEWNHVRFSDTRFLMALYMGATMTAIMLAFMLAMYRDARKNTLIFGVAMLVFVAGLYLARSQSVIGDVAYMKAMIPHHSIAILTSGRAQITDPRVRKLADEIIASQRREIAEMDLLIKDLQSR